MIKGLNWILRSWDRDSKKDKRIIGFKLNIAMKPRNTEAFREWCPVDEALYIPTNKHDRLRLDLAEEMGLRVKIGSIVDIDWIMIEGCEGDIPHNSFLVESRLPCKVMFGNQTPQTSLPENQYFPDFEMATKVELDRSYDFSKRRANTWEKMNTKITQRTSTWRSGTERKDNFRRPSFLHKKVQAQSPVRNATSTSRINPNSPAVNSFVQTAPGVMGTNPAETPIHKQDQVSSGNQFLLDSAEKMPNKALAVEEQRYEENSGLKHNFLKSSDNEAGEKKDTADNVAYAKSRSCGLPNLGSGQAPQSISEHEKKSGLMLESCEAEESNDIKLRNVQTDRQDRLLGSDSGVVVEHSRRNSILPELQSCGNGAYGATRDYRESAWNSTSEVVSNSIADNTNHLRSLEEARAKIQARKRGKAPKIRRVKLDKTRASQSADPTPVSETHEEWVYDSSARAYFKVDSDTGSRIWYEDSDSEDVDE